MAIFGYLDVPLVYMSTRWWRTQHPAPVFWRRAGIGDRSEHDAGGCGGPAGWLMWGIFVASLRYVSEYRAQKRGAGRGAEVAGVSRPGQRRWRREIVMGDMGHRHLVIAYAATIVIHLAYLAYVTVKVAGCKARGELISRS